MTEGKTIMKTHTYSSRNALILMATCLFLSGYPAGQAISADTQPRPAAAGGSTFVKPANGAARLIVRRVANLGNFVVVHLYVDRVLVATIGYGRAYEGVLTPGRHVLSVLPTPHPKWPAPWQMTLDVRSGQIYSFTAMGDSGYLVLRALGEPELPRGR
jgi:hypothetical protein